MDYRRRIEKYRDERNWTTHHMAIEAGINTSTAINWFTRNSTPTVDMIEKLCVAFGITLSEFFNDSDEVSYLSDEQKSVMHIWDLLSKKEKEYFLRFLEVITERTNPQTDG